MEIDIPFSTYVTCALRTEIMLWWWAGYWNDEVDRTTKAKLQKKHRRDTPSGRKCLWTARLRSRTPPRTLNWREQRWIVLCKCDSAMYVPTNGIRGSHLRDYLIYRTSRCRKAYENWRGIRESAGEFSHHISS